MERKEPIYLSVSQSEKRLLKAQFFFQRCVRKCEEWGIPVSDNIVFADKIDKSERYYAITTWDSNSDVFTITVSELIWDEYGAQNLPEALFNILMHELCHTIAGAFNHGAKWKHWVCLLNEEHGCKINPHPYSSKKTDLY